jgi:hypothetical protein
LPDPGGNVVFVNREIGIIKVIHSIADQTNLLALKAAIPRANGLMSHGTYRAVSFLFCHLSKRGPHPKF